MARKKNGFLQIDEVHPEYYHQAHDPSKGHKYPLIQRVLKPGQEVLVQVVKEPTGTKGAFLTSYISLPGRFVVLTPGRDQIGVSRKVEDEKERARLKTISEALEPGEGLGLIIRTASIGQNKTAINKDLQFLKRLWKEVRKKGTSESAPSLIYQEPDLAARAIRDYLSDDVSEVWIDHKKTAEDVAEFASLIFPRRPNLVKQHDIAERSLWDRFNLLKQLDQIYSRRFTLPSGGELVFDQTEALMSIDINSGKIGGKSNFSGNGSAYQSGSGGSHCAAAPAPRCGRADRHRFYRNERPQTLAGSRAYAAQRAENRPRAPRRGAK